MATRPAPESPRMTRFASRIIIYFLLCSIGTTNHVWLIEINSRASYTANSRMELNFFPCIQHNHNAKHSGYHDVAPLNPQFIRWLDGYAIGCPTFGPAPQLQMYAVRRTPLYLYLSQPRALVDASDRGTIPSSVGQVLNAKFGTEPSQRCPVQPCPTPSRTTDIPDLIYCYLDVCALILTLSLQGVQRYVHLCYIPLLCTVSHSH